MRFLTEYELALVAGGTASSDAYPGGSGGGGGGGGAYVDGMYWPGFYSGSSGSGDIGWIWVSVPTSVQVGDYPVSSGVQGHWEYQGGQQYAGGSNGGWGIYDDAQQLVVNILNLLFSTDFKTTNEQKANEDRISSQFNPNDVLARGTIANGAIDTWMMKDGSIYYDMNHNGRPDYQTMYVQDGSLYGNDGSGWKALTGNG